jgi:hypothetical protein
MGNTHAARETLPDREIAGPVHRRSLRMTKALRWRHRFPLLVALLGSLAVASLGWTSIAFAKPYLQQPGPDPTSGDPTGDDLPDPSPKPKNLAPHAVIRGETDATGSVNDVLRVVGSWEWLVRYLRMFPLR